MAKYDARLKAMERHMPRAQFDFMLFIGPCDDGLIHGQDDQRLTLAEFEALTDGIYLQLPARGDEKEIMDRLMAGDESIKPYLLVGP